MKESSHTNYVTRTELKDVLKTLATKDDLKNFATKDDFARLTWAVEKNTHDIEEIKETINTKMATKDDVRLIINTIDAFTKKVSVFDQEEMVQSLHLQEARVQLADHEKRLNVLESPR